MKIAIMQPYFFPYIGYFQLINAVDKFVIYDDVNFIKQGWINRNRILEKNKITWFTLQLLGASSNKYIKDITLGNNQYKLLKTLQHNYSKATFFEKTFPLIENIFTFNTKNLSCFISNSLSELCNYLNIKTEFLKTSNLDIFKDFKGEERLIKFCKFLSSHEYINPIGGKNLYSKENFTKHNIEIKFLDSKNITYKQFSTNFIPNLSIIDILMFNSKDEITQMLDNYELS